MFSILTGIHHCFNIHIPFISNLFKYIAHINKIIFFLLFYRKWSAGVGPTKDAYTIGDNQQYKLSVPAGLGSVWVLLTRHITTIEDFRENKEYITLLVYQNNGKRVYYPCKYKNATFLI